MWEDDDMSTKAIREALNLLGTFIKDTGGCDHAVNICVCGEGEALRDAHAEIEAIEKAARALDRLHIGDYVYEVRGSARVMRETPNGANTWEHPDVKAWGEASELMRAIAKQEP